MKSIWVIAKREMLSFFGTPLGYAALTLWLLWQGLHFYQVCYLSAAQPVGRSVDPLSSFFGGTTLFYLALLAFVPLLTMRLIADENRNGTMETLLASPLKPLHIVLGKYVAGMAIWISLWLPTLIYVWMRLRFGTSDMGQVASAYLGIFVLGVSHIALGLLGSSTSKSPLLAALTSFVLVGGFLLIGLFQFLITDDASRDFFESISIFSHMQAFTQGVVDTRHLILHLSIAIASLFIAERLVDLKRVPA